MQKIRNQLLLLCVLVLLALSPVVSAEEQVTKITWVGSSDEFATASQTNIYSDLIEYTFIPIRNPSYGPSDELLEAVESGFLGTQDVIVCQGLHPDFGFPQEVNDSYKAAHDGGTSLYSINPMGDTPYYFDYVYDGSTDDRVNIYYSNMENSELEESVRLENAENLLIYLAMHKEVTYISYGPSTELESASQTSAYSDFIEYTFINYIDYSDYPNITLTPDLITKAESGFFETQDVILCQGIMEFTFDNTTVNNSLKAAHDRGTDLYIIDDPMLGSYTPPFYFDYHSNGSTDDPVCNYYSNICDDTFDDSVRLENAENLLAYLTMNTKITYISYGPSTELESASQTSAYSDFIEYTFINYIDYSDYPNITLTPDLITKAESGFFETQDVILCQGIMEFTFDNTTVNNSLKAAHDRGTDLYIIDDPMLGSYTPPSYFDYHSNGSADDPVCNYYSNMCDDTFDDSVRLENAENLLLHLAKHTQTMLKVAIMTDHEVNPNDFVFVLGTDFNGVALNNAANDSNISENVNITIFTPSNPVPVDFDFSDYGMIFIESQDKAIVQGWISDIKYARAGGANVIGYNISSDITLPNVDLYSDNFTDIERYWIQGGDTNMENMLKFMGQKFSGLWECEEIHEPVVLQDKVNMTFIIGADSNVYYLSNVINERNVITDCFNINFMLPGDAIENLNDASDQDFIMLYMVGASDIYELMDVLSDAEANNATISLGSSQDSFGLTTIDTFNAPHNVTVDYLATDGQENMENLVRYVGAELFDSYIHYSPVAPPAIPDDGIYHPDALPRIFENSAEYLDWYSNRTDGGHIYNASAPTIGIVTYEIQKEPIYLTTDDAIIRYLESKGCNVIYTTDLVCNADVDYFTKDGEVLVDAIIHLKAFYLNYENQTQGVEYLQKYNVPILKGIQDPYTTPEEFNNSLHGTDLMSLPAMVTQPEVDGCTDFIWISGSVSNPENPNQNYYEPIMSQVEFLCDRAIGWAELGRASNEDKKVSILYYNHDGGKENIGASYLDIGSSFTLLLEQMRAEGYDIGNGTIPNGTEFIDLFIESRNVGAWAPGELEKVVNSGKATLWPVEEYLVWYNTLPESVRTEVEDTWGEAPGDIMVYENESGEYFVMPTVQLGNVIFMPQPTKAKLSDESLIYHNESIPLTHQYMAAYFWINQVYDADAIIHFGTHGSMEWSPGKEIGLWRYDYPSICAADTPIIYPYIMDNVGEGSQAKHRGYAVMIDHLTPPIMAAGIYGDLTTMHDTIHSYEEAIKANSTMADSYRNSTINLYTNLSMEHDLGVSPDELRLMSDEEFGEFVGSAVHDYLHTLQETLMPYGVHTFGVAPEEEKLVCMVKSMLRSDFVNHIYNVIPKDTGDEEDWEDEADTYATELLNATVLNGMDVVTAQDNILGLNNTTITADLTLGLDYADKLGQTTREINQTLRALNAEYIEPAPGNDPIRNPDALPTGRNFYGFDQRKFPDVETQAMGVILADQLVDDYYINHNETYPNKVSYVLWAMETLRHHGLMEAQIYSLLGVEPVRDDGRITGFTVIDIEDMNHPRIDVVIHSSGLYRDTFPYQLELIDEAIRTVAERDWESCEDNYVRCNSLAMEAALIDMGYDNETAHYLSRSRIFSEAPGNYDNGMEDAIAASDTWEDESKLADLFISSSSYIYGQDMWGEGYEDVFTMNLMDVDAAVHSDSTNLFGLLDGDGYYGYLGSIGLTIRSLTGETPELYIANQENTDDLQMMTLKEAFRTELRARNFNPTWISGMMEGDYAGARQMMKSIEYLWGWDVTNPDMVADSDWDEIYDIYVMDKYDIGVDEFLKTENPYQYQSITARMLETIRKDYWDASEEVKQSLVKEYVESVVNDGVTCCHHTCGNALLDEYVQGIMSVPGVVDQATIDEYNRLMQEATQRDAQSSASSTRSSSSGTTASASVVNTTSTSSVDGGYGTTTDQPADGAQQSTPDNYVEGYEMTKESTKSDSASSSTSFSGADILGSVLVVLSVAVITIGFRRRRL